MTALDEVRASDLLERATQQVAAGDLAGAGARAVEAAALLPPDSDQHTVYVSAAQLLTAAGRHAEGAAAWSAAADGAVDEATRARYLDAAGVCARTAGDWDLSAAAHQRALALVDDAGATLDPLEVAVLAQNLAVTYKYTGRFDEAAHLYDRALALAEAAHHPQLVATICHNLGGLAHARGDAEAGLAWARRAIETREPLGDPLGLAGDRGALAGLLIDLGRLAEATDLLQSARAVFAAHGKHLEVAIVDGNLATVALERGDLTEAERRARAALQAKQRSLGARSPDLAVTLTTLGTIRRCRGDLRDSRRLHRRALELLRPNVEADHPLLRTIEENLAAATDRR